MTLQSTKIPKSQDLMTSQNTEVTGLRPKMIYFFITERQFAFQFQHGPRLWMVQNNVRKFIVFSIIIHHLLNIFYRENTFPSVSSLLCIFEKYLYFSRKNIIFNRKIHDFEQHIKQRYGSNMFSCIFSSSQEMHANSW